MEESNFAKRLDNCSAEKLINYFVMISFLIPRGYAEFSSIYKKIFTYGIWSSTLIIWIQFFKVYFKNNVHRVMKKEEIFIITYFLTLILITIVIRGGSINGYQKLIAYPSICLFTILNFKKNPKIFLNCINNVILGGFILNQIVLRDFFSKQYHITFLGHVQMVAQIGSLGVFCALLYYKIYNEKKNRTIISVLLILLTMLTTDASSALICCIMLCIFGLLYRTKKYNFLTKDSKIYIIGGSFLSIIIVIVSIFNNSIYHNAISFLDFSGRSFVWRDAIAKIKNSPIFGYGIEGILLNVFWNKLNNSPGFNYAHNQNLQNFLDGGIISFVLFYVMFISFFKNINKSLNLEYKAIINSILICFSTIMFFESTSQYYYMYIYLAIVYSLPNVINYNGKGEKKDGINK